MKARDLRLKAHPFYYGPFFFLYDRINLNTISKFKKSKKDGDSKDSIYLFFPGDVVIKKDPLSGDKDIKVPQDAKFKWTKESVISSAFVVKSTVNPMAEAFVKADLIFDIVKENDPSFHVGKKVEFAKKVEELQKAELEYLKSLRF